MRKVSKVAISSKTKSCEKSGKHLWERTALKGEVKAKIKISPVVVLGVLSRMVLVRES